MESEGQEVYIVMSGSGEYSDRRESTCGVFSDMADAQTYIAEENEFKEFINPMREGVYKKCPIPRPPVMSEGPKWGYTNFKKSKVAPRDTEAEWLVKVTENKIGLDRRNAVHNKWREDMAKWTLEYWTSVYDENPRWQHKLIDNTGTMIQWPEDDYWIVSHIINDLVKKKK